MSDTTIKWPRRPAGAGGLVFVHVGFGERAVPYEPAWDLQRRTHARRVAGEIADTALLLEHRPVYTAGKRTAPADRPAGDPGAPVIDVDRGGSITWHGPGQLTCYPIVRLAVPVNLIGYVRLLEGVMMDACAELGLETIRVPGRTGLWVPGRSAGVGRGGRRGRSVGNSRSGKHGSPDRKIGSIGIRVSRGVTMHGFQINCDPDLAWFDRIVACGIDDAGSTSLTAELGRTVPVAEVVALVERHLGAALEASETFHRTLAQLDRPEVQREAGPAQAIAL